MSELRKVTIYTDGGCIGNPGPGGYGAVLLCDGHRKELSGGYRLTTNNRMELMGAIVALESLKERCKVTLYSDSKYVVDAMMLGWAAKWKANDWKRNKNDRALNPDLWERLLAVSRKHDVEFVWVKGHAGNRENECCDKLAKMAAMQSIQDEDEDYRP
jgi:ribonuclease HI